jgi:hypothetical protein
LKYDIEMALISESLHEPEKKFPPSYPFMEELDQPDAYMESRCPAWCDRIIYNQNVKEFLDNQSASIEYGMAGQGICMGDHKPIYMSIKLERQNDKSDVQATVKKKSNLNKSQVLLNQNLVDFNEASIDIHDFALFKHFAPLKALKLNGTKFTLSSNDNNYTQNNKIRIENWLKCLLEIQLRVLKSSHHDFEYCFESDDHDLIFKHLEKESILTQFFIKDLNGNLFRLKDLYTFLNDLLAEFDLSNKNVNRADFKNILLLMSESSSETPLRLDDQCNHRVFYVLNKFLHTKCAFNLFKNAILLHNNYNSINSKSKIEYDENFNIL